MRQQARMSVAVEIASRDRRGVGKSRARSEFAASVVQKNAGGLIAAGQHREIGNAVFVEIGGQQLRGSGARRETCAVLESAVAVAQQDRNRAAAGIRRDD